jgi:hypothetical protein
MAEGLYPFAGTFTIQQLTTDSGMQSMIDGIVDKIMAMIKPIMDEIMGMFDDLDFSGLDEGSGSGSGTQNASYGNSGPPLPADSKNPAAIAQTYLGRTYEAGPNDLDKDRSLGLQDISDNINCANFVWGCLKKAGLVSRSEYHQIGAEALGNKLKQKGWTVVSRSEARPGDVWVKPASGGKSAHTELVHSNKNGKITLIGSNNRLSNGNQQISYDSYSGNQSGYFLRAPGR